MILDELHLSTYLYVYSGSWSSKSNDLKQWIQAEFAAPFKITAIQTQGRHGGPNQWVKSFKLSYGNDGVDWSDVNDKDGKEMVNVKMNLFLYMHHIILIRNER